MVQERSIPPEKRLLNLIEGNNEKTEYAHANAQAQRIKHQGLSVVSPAAWAGRIFFLRDNLKKWLGLGSNQLNVKGLNAILIFLLCILLVCFMANLISSMIDIMGMARLKLSGKEGLKEAQLTGPVPGIGKSMEYYLGKVSRRNIFKISPEYVAVAQPSYAGTASKAAEVTDRFKLVGISWSKNPDAMIEDTQALRTFFVKIGQMIGSSVKVQVILKDRVILLYNGEEVELR